MKKKFLTKKKVTCVLTALLVSSSFWSAQPAEACTTTIVTKGASADGSTYVTHSNDAFSSDPNIVYVPAKDHAPGSMRKVYPSAIAWDTLPEYSCYDYPRLVAAERADAYNHPDKEQTKPLGEIPEVAHTYAYIDSDYGVMNEHGLMLGECTNNAAPLEYSKPGKGRGIFYASELGRVALERCRTAREAIQLMGSLIDEYGLWGTGETLLVADKDEGWVLEMQPTPSGKGGFWIAQRVPDGEFFVAANQFRIRAITENNPNQIYNPRLPEMLKEVGWAAYDSNGQLDWVLSLKAEECYHPYFSLRRVWRAQDLVAPSLKLPAKVQSYDTKAYPFSVRPDHPLKLEEIMDLHRDYYQGTDFDRAKGVAAGVFDSPYRHGDYQWERAIASRNVAYTWITQAKDALPCPIFWLSVNAPAESVYIPLAVAPLPEPYQNNDRAKYDATKAWWITEQITMLTRGYYSAFHQDVLDAAHKMEADSMKITAKAHNMTADQLKTTLADNAVHTLDEWRKLYGQLLVKTDGDHHIGYGKAQQLQSDNVQNY